MSRNARHRPPRLGDADLSLRARRETYDADLAQLQRKLAQIQQAYLFTGRSAVIVFEGWDAAGKGGAIRRLSAALDPRGFKVWPIGPPRNYYLQRHYFLRFMERLPPKGAIAAFDRSWYGRVLVERVEALTPKRRWTAAYREIAHFERMLIEDGTRLVKLFFHISPEEQLRRFEARLADPLKRWKLTFEDFRNRLRWDDYAEAAEEMFRRTSTVAAPWRVIPAEDKRHGRLAALSEIARVLGKGVDLAPPAIDEALIEAAAAHFPPGCTLLESLRGRTE